MDENKLLSFMRCINIINTNSASEAALCMLCKETKTAINEAIASKNKKDKDVGLYVISVTAKCLVNEIIKTLLFMEDCRKNYKIEKYQKSFKSGIKTTKLFLEDLEKIIRIGMEQKGRKRKNDILKYGLSEIDNLSEYLLNLQKCLADCSIIAASDNGDST